MASGPAATGARVRCPDAGAHRVLLAHLLPWQYQPRHRSKRSRRTLIEQRKRIHRLIADSPSLEPKLPAVLADAYDSALRLAAEETGRDESDFPQAYPVEDLLDGSYIQAAKQGCLGLRPDVVTTETPAGGREPALAAKPWRAPRPRLYPSTSLCYFSTLALRGAGPGGGKNLACGPVAAGRRLQMSREGPCPSAIARLAARPMSLM